MQPMGYAPQPAVGAAGYEFNEAENFTISGTARYARIWGFISLISGILVFIMGTGITVLFAVMGTAMSASSGSTPFKPAMISALGVALIPSSLVSIIGGIFYIQSGGALRRVAETQGNDIPLLMDAVKSLSRAFMIEAIAMIIGFIVGLVLGFAMQIGGHS